MDSIRLLMLNFEFPPLGGGGGSAHRALLGQFAGRSDLDIDVLTSASKPGLWREDFSANIVITKVGVHKKDLQYWRRTEILEWLLKAGFRYRRFLRERPYDLVHAFFGFPSGWLCYRSAKRLPYIVSLRGSDVPGMNSRLTIDYKLLGPLFKRIWKKAGILTALSDGLKEQAAAFLPGARIEVIPNGVDLERFSPGEEQRNDFAREPLRLLTVGRLSVTKRIELLLETVEVLRAKGSRIHLTIVGGGALEGRLRTLVEKRRLGSAVQIVGRMDASDVPGVYRRHDIFVSASLQEGMSNAMLEAMASGLPIITTRCEGVEELIRGNGVIVERPEAESLAAAILELANDGEKRRAMGRAARDRARLFSWPQVARRYLEHYRAILGR